MSIELYTLYSRAAALEALGIEGAAPVAWGGQLVIGASVLALFVTLGPAENASHFPRPEHFCYRPDREYALTLPGEGWVPEALATHRRAGRELHLFVQEGEVGCYRSAGRLGLGMYSLPRDYRQQRAEFDLEPRLPRDLWVRYGGYPGWKLTLRHQERLLAAGDEAVLDACLREVRDVEDVHLSLTRYEGDGLQLLANESQAYLAYENEWGGEEVVINRDYPDDTEEVAAFSCSCGIGLEMPLCNVISRTQGLEAVREFFVTGAQPVSVEWSDE
jgi:hypothetical protein